jgi:hypothetical protein
MMIERVQWPERTCREPVWSVYMAYGCELSDIHRGPCASNSVAASLQRREAWEEAQKAQETAENDQRKDQSA